MEPAPSVDPLADLPAAPRKRSRARAAERDAAGKRHRERRPAPRLSGRERRSKEKILTQPEPAKVLESTYAVVVKQGSVFLLSDDGGDVPWKLPHGFGLYSEDCRFLDGYLLMLNGRTPTVLSSTGALGFEARHHLTNPGLLDADGGPGIAKNTITIERRRLIRGRVLHELLAVRNYNPREVGLRLELRFRTRFEDIFVLKGFVKGPRGMVEPARFHDGDAVELGYEGVDGCRRTTAIAFSVPPDALEEDRALFDWKIGPGKEREIAISVTPREHARGTDRRRAARPHARPELVKGWLRRTERIWHARATEVRASNPLFERVLDRALGDLRLLRSSLEGQHYFAAGIPWFATLFGRDAATVCLQTLPFGTVMARETLRLLAKTQAGREDAYRDASPGKILHEYRTGELAQSGEIPQSPAYYGTVDATLLFLILLAEYVSWSADLELARELLPHVEAALAWSERCADANGGWIAYFGKYENGLINQGWKDSGNAILDAAGSLPTPPIALCEVQAYAYRAWRQTAGVLRLLAEGGRALELESRAEELRERFERQFWSDDLGCYVLALQEGGRPVPVVASNAGQVLWGGIAGEERARTVAARLMAPDMFSGWGVRTLSADAKGYNPVSYHLGSVWPHDNGIIANGFRKYGQDEPALQIFEALFDAAASFRDYRMPELFCGFDRGGGEVPVGYPVACSPQAWAAGAIPHALWSLLGLRADAPSRRLEVVRPRLPVWLEWLELGRMQVGDACVDLRFERDRETGDIRVRSRVERGDLEVEHVGADPTADRVELPG